MKYLYLLLLLLSACLEEGDSLSRDDGTWLKVRPPPGAPVGTQCWVFHDGVAQNAWGGPACFPPEKECDQ